MPEDTSRGGGPAPRPQRAPAPVPPPPLCSHRSHPFHPTTRGPPTAPVFYVAIAATGPNRRNRLQMPAAHRSPASTPVNPNTRPCGWIPPTSALRVRALALSRSERVERFFLGFVVLSGLVSALQLSPLGDGAAAGTAFAVLEVTCLVLFTAEAAMHIVATGPAPGPSVLWAAHSAPHCPLNQMGTWFPQCPQYPWHP